MNLDVYIREAKALRILCVPTPHVEIPAREAAHLRFSQKVRGESRFCVRWHGKRGLPPSLFIPPIESIHSLIADRAFTCIGIVLLDFFPFMNAR